MTPRPSVRTALIVIGVSIVLGYLITHWTPGWIA